MPSLASDARVKTAFPSVSGAQVTMSVAVAAADVLVGVSVLVRVGVARSDERTLLKPRTVLLDPPVTVAIRHDGLSAETD
jgi:hypothetical protein